MFYFKQVALLAVAYGAPVLTFDHQAPAVKPASQVVERPFGKDVVEDYESKDGNYKYHAEMHYLTDSNKDGFAGMSSSKMMSQNFGSISGIEQELNKMMENAFNIDSIFGKIPKIPSMLDRFNNFKENEAVELTEGSGDSNPLFFF